MFEIYLGKQKVGTTALEYGDPPMGVVVGKVQLACSAAERIAFLESLGAVRDGLFLVIKDHPDLHAADSSGVRVGSDFCLLAYSPELEEGEFEACAIDAIEYQARFPQHVKAYEEQFKE